MEIPEELEIDRYVLIDDVEERLVVKFTKAEILRRNIFHAHLFTYENDYFQYSQGLMPQEVWEAKLKALAFFYNQCDMRSLWNSRQQFFPEGYVSIIKSITDECVNQ